MGEIKEISYRFQLKAKIGNLPHGELTAFSLEPLSAGESSLFSAFEDISLYSGLQNGNLYHILLRQDFYLRLESFVLGLLAQERKKQKEIYSKLLDNSVMVDAGDALEKNDPSVSM